MAHLQVHSDPAPSSGAMKHAESRTLSSPHGHPRDVPASASAAAALGWAKQRQLGPETMSQNHTSPSAARAATLAAERSLSPRGQVRKSSVFPRTLRSGSPHADLGNSAAAQAYKARSPRRAPQATHKDSPSLLAAQEAIGATRPRSVSSPVLKQPLSDQASGDGVGNRDDAATQRWELTPESGTTGGSTMPATTLPANMYTANPPVSLEVEEKKKADELRASAVAMAQSMFKQQSKLTASFLHDGNSRDDGEPAQFDHRSSLHEAAYKLAHKCLAEMYDENQRGRELQAHYAPSGAPRRWFTVADRFRRRVSSDSDVEFRTGRVPNHMSPLESKKPEPRETEPKVDRTKVLEAARRNVRSQLEDIDQTVADRTGMVPPSTRSAWESKALPVAQETSTAAATEESHEGERDAGGGLYVAEEDIEAVAKQNVKPFLLELDERAEKERERERKLKEEKEANKIEAEKKKAYDKEVEDVHRKLKAKQKEKEKERQRTFKEEERARKKSEKAQRRAAARGSAVTAAGIDTGSDPARPSQAERQDGSQRHVDSRRTSGISDDGTKEQGFSPGKVKSWLRSKLSRQRPPAKDRDNLELGRGFVGGHVLRSPAPSTDTGAASSTGEPGSAGTTRHPHPGEARAQTPIQGYSEEVPQTPSERDVSSGTEDSFRDARESTSSQGTPPRVAGVLNHSASSARDSRFVEMMD